MSKISYLICFCDEYKTSSYWQTKFCLPIIEKEEDVKSIVSTLEALPIRVGSECKIIFTDECSVLHQYICISTLMNRFQDSIVLEVISNNGESYRIPFIKRGYGN